MLGLRKRSHWGDGAISRCHACSTRIVDAGIAIECCLGERVRIELGIGMAPDLGDLGGSQVGGFLKRDEGPFLR